MGKMEVFQMDSEGAGWTPIEELSVGDKVELELAIVSGKVQLLCVSCGVPVPSGMGHSYCERHKPKAKYCDRCDCEMIVDSLYCSHCFTGRGEKKPDGRWYHIPEETPTCK